LGAARNALGSSEVVTLIRFEDVHFGSRAHALRKRMRILLDHIEGM
jgi:hypothetical protein